MGIPKFFRWISERYPLTSQLITPNSIPTFDNLYLDMNGIIHNCSHPPSSENDPHFRITEEQMVLAIFNYIDHLFTKIKPQKVFFMAIDGVAPRAKMNQQRSRRFRTAREVKEMRAQAERKGEKLPEEKAFDSNCITPGTPFMARLSAHLKYFVNKKISEDAEWRNVKVILSGHDVPGEGEHKIQEFIRLSKAQPEYDPNTRHCLYGLDADLIMLGLLSHDPHFCLLREEVTFGRKTKKTTGLAQTNFFLLHLSLLREYLNLEFQSLAPTITFEYDLERIIDDFILLSIFVGNDFLPHLPNLHINEGAMENIWNIYKAILPKAGGYLNESGEIALDRLQLLLDELAKLELDVFEKEFADGNWYKGKQHKEIAAMEIARKSGKMVVTKDQKKLLNKIKKFVTEHQSKPSAKERLAIVNDLAARDRRFVQELADSLRLRLTWDEVDEYGQPLAVFTFDMEGVSENGDAEDEDADAEATGEDSEWKSDDDDEGKLALQRVFDKYARAKVVDNTVEDFENSYEETLKEKMNEWKKTYYKDKLEINFDDPEDLGRLIFRYIEGLQWILKYYYRGVASWGWFYDYHYAPRMTDLKGIADFKFDFQLGKPFKPFQQLMGVLPEESREHVPLAYRDLMYEDASPIIDFYPIDFEQDMNGKKQEWEAVVKIPFIDEKRLLSAMASRDHRLTPEEQSRNQMGQLSSKFMYDESEENLYPSSLPGFFPDIAKCHCHVEPFNLPTLGGEVQLIFGLRDGVQLGASALAGFPSLNTLPHQATLGYHSVSVFQSDSKNPSMVITITGKGDKAKASDVAEQTVGQRVFLGWPFLQEGMVVAVSDDTFKYELQQVGKSVKAVANSHSAIRAVDLRKKAERLEHFYSKRFGVLIGHVDVVLHVRPLKGLKRLDTGALIKEYEGPEKEYDLAYQLAVKQVAFEDERYIEQPATPMVDDFPIGQKVIFLGDHAYGVAAQVKSVSDDSLNINIAFFPNEVRENAEFSKVVNHRPGSAYKPSFALARDLHLSALAFSRITSSLLVQLSDGKKINVGLSLKFESKGLKVLGYSRKNDRGWEFSDQAAKLLHEYKTAFPQLFRNLDGQGHGIITSEEILPGVEEPDKVIKEVQKWLKERGVSDFDPVSLFAEQLEKNTVLAIQELARKFQGDKTHSSLKRALIQGIPRQAVLKPEHAAHRLQGQTFRLGDRVVMVQEYASGGVPLGMKGVVVGLNSTSVDVVWDVPFMGGETLGGRCSEYHGSTVPFSACLNLSNQQFKASIGGPATTNTAQPFVPRLGPHPVVPSSHFRPAANQNVAILNNPNRVPRAPTGDLQYGNATKGAIRPPRAPAQHVAHDHRSRMASALVGANGLVHPRAGMSTTSPPAAAHGTLHHAAPAARGRGRGGLIARGGAPAVGVNGDSPAVNGAPAARGRGGGRGRGKGRGGAAAQPSAEAAS